MTKTNPRALLAALDREERRIQPGLPPHVELGRTAIRALHYLVEAASRQEPEEELPPVGAEVKFYDHSESKTVHGEVIRHSSDGLARVQTQDGVIGLPGSLLTVIALEPEPEPEPKATIEDMLDSWAGLTDAETVRRLTSALADAEARISARDARIRHLEEGLTRTRALVEEYLL